ncbi:MAG: hypothetical protein ROO76_03750 [Terriglobia bacterium]|nr:hypothetical protein [Terriglobia bacterium]
MSHVLGELTFCAHHAIGLTEQALHVQASLCHVVPHLGSCDPDVRHLERIDLALKVGGGTLGNIKALEKRSRMPSGSNGVSDTCSLVVKSVTFFPHISKSIGVLAFL